MWESFSVCKLISLSWISLTALFCYRCLNHAYVNVVSDDAFPFQVIIRPFECHGEWKKKECTNYSTCLCRCSEYLHFYSVSNSELIISKDSFLQSFISLLFLLYNDFTGVRSRSVLKTRPQTVTYESNAQYLHTEERVNCRTGIFF